MTRVIDPRGSCPTIYGPVQSRRHGRSLGINLGNPERKICTWGCLYCQCGMGSRSAKPFTDEFIPHDEILARLKATLAECGPIDSLTLAGNSEPASHPQFAEIVRSIRKLKHAMRARWVFNCLSNGSELDRDEVVSACDLLDEAWIKLDCGTDEEQLRLNRPAEGSLTVARQIERIRRLRRPRIQTLLWECPHDSRLANFNEANLDSLLEAYRIIRPQEVHVTTVSREPAVSRLEPVSLERLEEYCARIRDLGIAARAFPA